MLLIFYQISKNLVPIESTCNFNFIDCTSIWRSVALLLMHWWRRRDPADACTREKLPPGIRRHTQATCMDGAVFPYFLDLWARLCTVCMSVVSRQRRRCSIALDRVFVCVDLDCWRQICWRSHVPSARRPTNDASTSSTWCSTAPRPRWRVSTTDVVTSSCT